jgi:DNA polymerase-4
MSERNERSVSADDTFARELCDPRVLAAELTCLADGACEPMRARQLAAGRVTVKIRRRDFRTFTRQRAVAPAT